MAMVGVYQIPAANELAWRSLLANAAIAKGWVYREDPVDLSTIDPGQQVLVVTSDPELTLNAGIGPWTVLAADPTRAAGLLEERLGMGNDSLWHIARRGAAADGLLRRGGTLFNASDAEIDVQGFGPVSGPTSQEAPVTRGRSGPLTIYTRLPVEPGATASWSPDVYKLPENLLPGLTSIDLTGRDRLLIQGPYFEITPGTWALTVELEIQAPASGIPLAFEWGYGTDVVRLTETIRRPGLYQVTLEHVWPEANHADFKIMLMQPSFQGELRLVGSTVTRTA